MGKESDHPQATVHLKIDRRCRQDRRICIRTVAGKPWQALRLANESKPVPLMFDGSYRLRACDSGSLRESHNGHHHEDFNALYAILENSRDKAAVLAADVQAMDVMIEGPLPEDMPDSPAVRAWEDRLVDLFAQLVAENVLAELRGETSAD